MATLIALTMHQGNDEIVDVVITPATSGDDLSLVTLLTFRLKPDTCTLDTDASVTTLTSTAPSQITITAQTSAQIDATIYVPAASLADPYPRVWRVDAHVGATHRTAVYGPVTIVDL